MTNCLLMIASGVPPQTNRAID